MGLWVFVCCALLLVGGRHVQASDVVYDGRSLIINGSRAILFSGSIHYPRSTPQMWPSLIAKAQKGGLDVIQTYVFWNKHEPRPGQYNFNGRYDLVGFLKEVQAQGLYASLRIGPFIESEWSYGGLPFWLHDVPGIVFRSNNEPFKFYMQNFTTKIVDLMKSNGLYASQGGPIILSQIENEYQNVEAAFHENGPAYVKWAAEMAVGQKTGVPWMMCKQDDAPDPVINACNGMNCGETFKGPNSPNKPSIWTENWTSFYQVFGGEPYIRSAKDIAYAVALFIAKNGSFVNYYMYHGGTNFDRTASAYVTTAYYDQAPLDEYGIIRQPKWGHLKDLHAAVKQCSTPLLLGKPSNVTLGDLQQAFVFEQESGECAAFLANSDRANSSNVKFQGSSYELPPRSISILPDCKNVVFNTAKVSVQSSVRSSTTREKFDDASRWKEFQDVIPSYEGTSTKADGLLEQMDTTKDSSDYLWYTFSFDYKSSDGDQPSLQVHTRAHVIHAFINNVFSGSAHGSHNVQNFTFGNPISLKDGKNDIALLSVMAGLPDSGAYMEKKVSGLRRVEIQASGNTQDLTNQSWGYQVGLSGEELKIYTSSGSKKVKWRSSNGISRSQPLMWYKTSFATPDGSDPIALNLASMGKGEVWINCNSIGRYWVSFHTPKGKPSQTLYHIPRSFLKPTKNLLVLFEESGGDPLKITLETISVSRVCGHVSDSQPGGNLQRRKMPPMVRLGCPRGKTISTVEFASFGTPVGGCDSQYSTGNCHSEKSREAVEKACIGKIRCSVALTSGNFGGDPCPGTSKSLLVDARCS